MKKFLASALAITLIGSSVASFAQDHSSHGSNGQRGGMGSSEMHVMKQEMQKKMSATKTDEERQAVMAEQQKLMQGKRGSMMVMHSKGHSMGGDERQYGWASANDAKAHGFDERSDANGRNVSLKPSVPQRS